MKLEQDNLSVRRKRSSLARSYLKVFSTPDGEVVLSNLKKLFPADRPRFSPSTKYDPILAALNDGQSQVTLHIQTQIEDAPILEAEIQLAERQ